MIDYCKFNEIILPLIPYTKDDKYDDKFHKKISSLSFEDIDIGISYLMTQTKMLNLMNLTFSNYKINCRDKNVELVFDSIINNDIDKWCCMLEYHSGHIFLEMLSHESFINFIELNKSSRYLCIPTSLLNDGFNTNDTSSDGHVVSLIIDNILREVYLFDSNGKTNYFDNTIQYASDRLVNLLFKKYFMDLSNIYNLNYTYIENNIFNPSSIKLNRLVKNTSSNAYCMILSILVPHYLKLTQLSIYKAIQILNQVKEDDFIHLLKTYSLGFCDIIDIHRFKKN
jgi:hypothetical protein